MKICIVGEINSGKSTLCGKLLNKLIDNKNLYLITDTFSKEVASKKTIKNSYYYINNNIIINTPGHIEYIENIISAICNTDMAVLILKDGNINYSNLIYYKICVLLKKPIFIIQNNHGIDIKINKINEMTILNLFNIQHSEIINLVFDKSNYHIYPKEDYNSIILYDSKNICGFLYEEGNIPIISRTNIDGIFYNIKFAKNYNEIIPIYDRTKIVGVYCE